MRRREFVIAVPFLVCAELNAAGEAPIDGVWELAVPALEKRSVHYFMMKKGRGPAVKIRDIQTGQEYAGVMGPGGSSINFIGAIIPGGEHAFSGVIQQNGMLSGQTEVEGKKMAWTASKLTSVYYCSNHQPTHIAKSREDMERSTKEKKCEGWQRARPDSLG
jgi:hypothetical protein